jgi:HAD superfamily hydrolase (TIGR01509 family)
MLQRRHMTAIDQGIDAVIFDMDGLLLDSERLALRSHAEAAREFGIVMDEEFCLTMVGIPEDQCRVLVEKAFGSNVPADEYLACSGRQMEVLIDCGLLTLKPGAIELLSFLDRQSLPRALATSSGRARADRRLRKMGLFDRFREIVTRDDVERGKPHPDLFLAASQRLGVPPSNCLVLEDSYAGVKAATAAGCPVIMVPDLLPPTPEAKSACLFIANDLGAVRDWLAEPASSRGGF